MVSFVIVAKDKKKRINYAKEYCDKLKIDRFDITIIEKEASKTALSIGIEDVKRMQQKLFLKPIKSAQKAVIIEDAHLLTPEAQNALLKVLEEPPAHTIILLGSDSKEALLPTILSRCKIVALEEESLQLTEKDKEELATFLTALPNLSIGEKLKQAEQLAKDKDKAIVWIEKLILLMREKLLQTYKNHPQNITLNLQLSTLNSFQSLHTLLKTTNVNPRFAIENTLLNF